jgi:hypothetical protein
MNTLESYQQIYTYDTGNNLTSLAEDVGADVQSAGLLLCFVN